MYFDNLSSLLSMDGHGLFVWSAIIFSLVMMGLLIWVPVWLTRRFFSRRERHLRQAALSDNTANNEP